MTVRKRRKNEKIIIDLSSPQGNAFYLLATAKAMTKKLMGKDWVKIWQVLFAKMTESDFDNLVKVFDEHFGDFFDLIETGG